MRLTENVRFERSKIDETDFNPLNEKSNEL